MKERIEVLARECGIWAVSGEIIPSSDKHNSSVIEFFNAALELAAKEREELAEDWPSDDADDCAAAIRNPQADGIMTMTARRGKQTRSVMHDKWNRRRFYRTKTL